MRSHPPIARLALLAAILSVAIPASVHAVSADSCPAGMTLTNSVCTIVFNYTGSPQTFTVPAGLTALTVDALGAPGGGVANQGPDGGPGGEEKAVVPVTPETKLTVIVGQWGGQAACTPPPAHCTPGSGGYGGGGTGGSAGNGGGGGGGGGSFVFGAANELLIAAGGGGGNGRLASGGAGGGSTGGKAGGNSPGQSYPTESPTATGGGGATVADGGTAGASGVMTSPSCGNDGNNGTAGTGAATSPSTFGVGGTGGATFFESTPCSFAGQGSSGGGGGGYHGGGGGGSGYYYGGGGGGGSGFVVGGATGATSGVSSYAAGNGQVTISLPQQPQVQSVTPSSGPLKGGNTVEVSGTGFTGAMAVCLTLVSPSAENCSGKFSVTSDTSLKYAVPNGLHVVSRTRHVRYDLRVQGKDGLFSAVNAADTYTYGFSVDGVSPNTGPLKGGNAVRVTGHGLSSATQVCL
ncbi:MAG TPA: IPT/TIG domain-containing protein, partial [Chloroflexota bacterium]|nr:IPT/TIG domain-containing protein [Chloroflexota bacterium]